MKLKRFIVCGWEHYYPAGGLGNIQTSADIFEDALPLARALFDVPTVEGEKRGWADDKFPHVAIYDRDGDDIQKPLFTQNTE